MFEVLCRLSRACTTARGCASILPANSHPRGLWHRAAQSHQHVCVDINDALVRKLRSLGVRLNAGARAARRAIYHLTFQRSDKLTPQMRDEYLVDMAIDFEGMSRERSRRRRKSSIPDLGPPGARMHTFETTPCFKAPGTQWQVVLNTPHGPRMKYVVVPDGHVRGATFTVQLPLRVRRTRRSHHGASASKP